MNILVFIIIIFSIDLFSFFSSVSVFQFFSLYIVSRAFVMFHLSTAAAADDVRKICM